MSQCTTDDRDIVKKYPGSVYRAPKFPDEPVKPRKVYKIKFKRARIKPEAKAAAGLKKRLDTTIFRLLVTAKSTSEFKELRGDLFPEYVEVTEAISTILRVADSRRDEPTYIDAAFASYGEHLQSDTVLLARFSGAMEEALFSLDTLHRAHFLVQDVIEAIRQGVLLSSPTTELQSAISHEWWSLLHLDCIAFAIGNKVYPTDEILLSLLEGFRHSVMAYALAKSAMETKYQSDYAQIDFDSIGKVVHEEYSSSERG